MIDYETRVLREGLSFGEGPRWRDGRLWYSDFYRRGVYSMSADGSDERLEVEVPTQPSGLGWLPDGSLLVVSMTDMKVLRVEGGRLYEHAELAEHCGFWANDMVVSSTGVAYVGNFGFDIDQIIWDNEHGVESQHHFALTNLVVVAPDGRILQVVPEMAFPNGMVLTDGGSTLVVAETFGARLSAFDVASDGTLSRRRVFADLPGVMSDGICLDAEGQIWVAKAIEPECIRVKEGGEVTARATTTQHSYACCLGGASMSTLYVVTAPQSERHKTADQRSGRVEAVEVAVPAT